MSGKFVTLTPGPVDYDALVQQLGGLVRNAERTLDALRAQLDLAIQLRGIVQGGDHVSMAVSDDSAGDLAERTARDAQ